MHYSTPNTNNSEDHLRTSAHTTTHPDAYHSTNTTARPCLFEGCGGVRTQVRMQYELHDSLREMLCIRRSQWRSRCFVDCGGMKRFLAGNGPNRRVVPNSINSIPRRGISTLK